MTILETGCAIASDDTNINTTAQKILIMISNDSTQVKNIIVTENLTKTVPTPHGELIILEAINFTIATGESIAIVGASGSGKSTLLALLAGLDTATHGQIIINGQHLTTMTEDQRATLRATTIGFVFQSFHLLPNLTALENVMLPLELTGVKQAKTIAQELLDRVGLGARLQHTPKQLSGGEQQRVAIARAFVGQPKILFADEPTGNLDSASGAQIIELLFDLNQAHHTTLILVTHDHQLSARCQRTLTLAAGKLL